ncbi:hypothetical protein FEM48_Zijuj09G0164400 [Ziziphus jujuba var. spinosa]|uniref:DNL-type domain-containing protein n=1 Tax=Ziziphus jujuba var. spinosa TaxID=714518 RepID=A0A978UU08_ZIZJJ|nr:uncharacterized protein LOC107427387 [Ziziphus jujuba var. spinosa]KAH7518358.1 hypothetical protein FEM48_Zijuj09G0163300 [Ziziphus jujuba var. spinosa]KAH7518368.1 hypothetical protein FEM48_Zijuj09G0164400 [Ziziphus jujuba var. spinosa]
METSLTSSSFSSFAPIGFFSPPSSSRKPLSSSSFISFPPLLASKSNENGADPEPDSNKIDSVPVPSDRNHYLSPLSQDAAMGLVLNAAAGRGWTTGSGLEGPSVPAEQVNTNSTTQNVSTFPWSLFTKSPRRRMLVAFTCNICGQRTTRAINPHAYTDGTVFVQCCGCTAFHKLVDNLNLFQEMNCYVNPSFNYRSNGPDTSVKYTEMEGDDDIFPTQ